MAKIVKKWEFSARNSRTTGYPWNKWQTLEATGPNGGAGQIYLVQQGQDFTCSVRAFTTQLSQQAARKKLAVQYDALQMDDEGERQTVAATDAKANAVIFRFYNPTQFNPEEE